MNLTNILVLISALRSVFINLKAYKRFILYKHCYHHKPFLREKNTRKKKKSEQKLSLGIGICWRYQVILTRVKKPSSAQQEVFSAATYHSALAFIILIKKDTHR